MSFSGTHHTKCIQVCICPMDRAEHFQVVRHLRKELDETLVDTLNFVHNFTSCLADLEKTMVELPEVPRLPF